MNEIVYKEILRKITMFRDGKLNLLSLVNDLEVLASKMESSSSEWLSRFRSEWEKLEEVNAYSFETDLPPEFERLSSELLEEALRAIESLVDRK